MTADQRDLLRARIAQPQAQAQVDQRAAQPGAVPADLGVAVLPRGRVLARIQPGTPVDLLRTGEPARVTKGSGVVPDRTGSRPGTVVRVSNGLAATRWPSSPAAASICRRGRPAAPGRRPGPSPQLPNPPSAKVAGRDEKLVRCGLPDLQTTSGGEPDQTRRPQSGEPPRVSELRCDETSGLRPEHVRQPGRSCRSSCDAGPSPCAAHKHAPG